MFGVLRLHIPLITSLSHQEPGLPRFSWNPGLTVLSIDGKAISLVKFVEAVHKSIDIMQNLIQRLFGECRFDDILKHIDGGLDPDDPNKWFREHPQDNTKGRSIFNDPTNDFEKFRLRLLEHMCGDEKYFEQMDTGVQAKIGKW
jgi:hypothetical protein